MLTTAAVCTAFGAPLELREIEIDDPGPGEVRVRILASGVCGSDTKLLAGGNPMYADPASGAPPIVAGHECVGVVEAVGPGVAEVAAGEHVVVSMNRWCGRCVACASGRAHLCSDPVRWAAVGGRMADGHSRLRTDGREVLPFIGIGSFARHAVVGARMLVPVPAAQADPALALLACGVVTGVGAVLNVAGVRAGQSVLVVGCGGVGLNVVQGAVLAGAARIVVADTVAAKLDLARALGATDVLLPGGDLAAQVAELVPDGVDHAFDVTGAPGVAAATMAATRPGGGTVLVGSPPADRPLEIPPPLLQGGRTLRGCVGGDASPGRDLPMLLDLVAAGRLALTPLVSERVGLDDVNGALRRQRAGEVARSLLMLE